ncbi:DNA primase [Pseudomonadota bacterium]|jgi:DNA primase|nr:DNA primase [Xanthomonadales bacterium]
MGGLIPDSFIEELLGRVDIVEVIERRVPLKKAGREYQARCPFHDEKTPSFTVSPQKQFYHCFGCGAHGSAIGFMMNYEGLEFVDAVEELARLAGLQVPRDTAAAAPRPSAGLYELLAEAGDWYQAQLKQSPQAIQYLKQRGLSGEVAARFGVGYAPAGWDGLMRQLGTDDQRLKLLQRAGMLSQGKGGTYDKFRDRIMFPIHDRRGRIIAFGGRALADDGPKYLNSPETELFHKGRELYGLYLARKSQAKLEQILVVEGYMDVVALAQFGFGNCVATLGTATTGDHAELLFRAADEAIYCFDGDQAGRKAAWRALEATLPRLREGRQARFLFLPEGEDPDSLVRRQGSEAFQALLADAQPLSEYFFDQLTGAVDMSSIDGRARLVGQAKPHLEQIPPGVFRDMMFSRLESLARHKVDDQAAGRPPRELRSAASRAPGTPRTAMRLALAHLVQNPSLASGARNMDVFEGCDLPGFEIYRELVDFCAKSPNMTTAQLLELWHDHPAQSHLNKLATWDLQGDEENLAREFRDAVTGLELQWIESRMEKMPKIVDLGPEDRQQLLALQQRRQQLIGELHGGEP